MFLQCILTVFGISDDNMCKNTKWYLPSSVFDGLLGYPETSYIQYTLNIKLSREFHGDFGRWCIIPYLFNNVNIREMQREKNFGVCKAYHFKSTV